MGLYIDRRQPEGSWTEEQWHAIHTKGAHILVAAAAGAGKTAVLVERIIQRILDPARPCDVDRLLVVTFTDAAAAQMRQRIADALAEAAEDEARPTEERERLRRQVALIDRASIQTLHGFCLWLLRRYFYLLEIDPLFRVLDGEEATLLKYETVDRMLEEQYQRAQSGDRFYALVDAYRDARSDAALRALLLALHDYAASLPDPDDWFARAEAMYQLGDGVTVDDLPWARMVVEAVVGELLDAEALMRSALVLAEALGTPDGVQAQLREEKAFVGDLAEKARSASWTELHALFNPVPSFKTLRFTGFDDDIGKKRIQDARDKAKRRLAEVGKRFFCHAPEVELQLLRESGPHVQELIRLVREFSRLYRQSKRARGVVDFSDLEQLAFRILQTPADDPEAISPCEEMRAHFVEVLVDEYQDINPLQNAILQRVARPAESDDPNLFMVGDVKQSIYRFRLADPTLFLHHLEHFQPFHEAVRCTEGEADDAREGVVIDLRANFRSREQVVDGVNFIFRQILTPGVGELAYDERAELVARAQYPPQEENRIELHVVESDPRRVPAAEEDSSAAPDSEDAGDEQALEHRTALEREAGVVARLVRDMIDRGDLVYDREEGGMRPVRPRDIVVLLRSTKDRANLFVEALRAVEIPAYAELGTGFFWAVEVETMLSLLRIIDNPRQDIPLAAVLRAPWVDLSTTEMARIRALHPRGDLFEAVIHGAEVLDDELGRKLQIFRSQLEEWRSAARLSSLGDLIQRLYNETGYPEYVQGLPGGAQRLVNLNALHERAARFDGFTQGGLTRFLRFVDSLQQEEGDLGEAPVLGEGDDVVRIMSIHKSKGLQFPVVIVADLGKQFNISDRVGTILYDGRLGIAPQWSDPGLGLRTRTLAHQAVAEARRRATVAEELRVLYVALTRAQERLLLVGSTADIWETAARWSQAADVDGWSLPDHMLARADSYFDWIGPAVLRHRDAEPLRAAARKESGVHVEVQDTKPYDDPSRWSITLWTVDQTAGLVGATAVGGPPATVDWEKLSRGEPLGRTVDPEVAKALHEALGQAYRFSASTRAPAKVSVTLLARELHDESEGAVLPPDAPPARTAHRPASAYRREDVEPFTSSLRKPRFMEEEKELGGAEHGTAMHTFLYHLDIGRHWTLQNLQAAANDLVKARLLTAAQRVALDLEAIFDFLNGELGQRLGSAARDGRLWREWAFTLSVELERLRDLLLTEAEAVVSSGDRVVVQGTVDALWLEDNTLYLIDYKTDRRDDPAWLLTRYEPQLQIYREAVERITGLPVGDAYLVHLRSSSQVIPLRAYKPWHPSE